MSHRQMHLGAFLFNLGNHIAAWRLPEVQPANLMRLSFYTDLAQTAERGLFDFVFLSDGLGINDRHESVVRRSVVARPEPLTLLGALAACTSHIGLAATVSSSFHHPYAVSRSLATLDFLSEGRAAINIVTSSTEQEAANFGHALLPHDERYARAAEFVGVMRKLWRSWEEEAINADQEEGTFANPDRICTIDHHDRYFSVRGPLNVPRPPQVDPVIIQAGTSPAGTAFAAANADLVFTVTSSMEESLARTLALRRAAAEASRTAGAPLVLPGVMPIVAATREEALQRQAELDGLVHPSLALAYLSDIVGTDLTGHDPDGPLPDLPPSAGEQGRRAMIQAMADAPSATLGTIARRMVLARGHYTLVGTGADIADALQRWFEAGACDGFNILAPWHPGGLAAFVDLVVPELQRRGLFRTRYDGHTLRDNLGLAVRPQPG